MGGWVSGRSLLPLLLVVLESGLGANRGGGGGLVVMVVSLKLK